jgi:hypothetical protein
MVVETRRLTTKGNEDEEEEVLVLMFEKTNGMNASRTLQSVM